MASVRCADVPSTDDSINKVFPVKWADLTQNIKQNPGTLIMVASLVFIFLILAIIATFLDRKKDATMKLKIAKWNSAQLKIEVRKTMATSATHYVIDRKDFKKTIKQGFQDRHPWLAVFARRSGSSFRSFDRCVCLLLVILLTLVLRGFLHDRGQNFAQIVAAGAVSFSFYNIYEFLLKHSGPRGFRDQWELDELLEYEATYGEPPSCLTRLDRIRAPTCVLYLLRVFLFTLAGLYIFLILLFGVKFDTEAEFLCEGRGGALAWYGASFAVNMPLEIFVYRPLSIAALYVVKFGCKARRDFVTRMENKKHISMELPAQVKADLDTAPVYIPHAKGRRAANKPRLDGRALASLPGKNPMVVERDRDSSPDIVIERRPPPPRANPVENRAAQVADSQNSLNSDRLSSNSAQPPRTQGRPPPPRQPPNWNCGNCSYANPSGHHACAQCGSMIT